MQEFKKIVRRARMQVDKEIKNGAAYTDLQRRERTYSLVDTMLARVLT